MLRWRRFDDHDPMTLHLRPAADLDLRFARDLTRQAMLPYYARHDLLWLDAGFDQAWHWRDNRMICRDTLPLGYISLSRDAHALFIRELHLLPAHRGQGVGQWVLEQVARQARSERLPRIRLMVFRDNPAQRLYSRHGFEVVGEQDSFLRMEHVLSALGR